MVGVPGAGWHLELVADADLARQTAPSDEDLLVDSRPRRISPRAGIQDLVHGLKIL